ncbi:MAG: alpha-hydroxy acid oxidase [Burkholderiaceae bacterium]
MAFKASQAYAIEDFRRAARNRLPRSIFDFYDGGAEDELSLADNRSAFQRIRLLPQVLRDVSSITTQTLLLGASVQLPVAIAPTGAVGFGRPGADIDLAKAASSAGIPYALSTTATTSIEKIADAAPGRLWFQAYLLRNKDFLGQLIERARVADYEALVITVDLPVGGKRERDFRNDFSVPFKFTPKNIWGFAQRPAWAFDLLRRGMPVLENLKGLAAPSANTSAIASSVGRNYDMGFNWDDLKKIRDHWPRQLIIKGILNPLDAIRVADIGCDALVVSNHGGRQLDGAPATLDALPSVVAALQGRIPALVDGGIRRGSDILKALALGAQGVMLGRATLFAAVADGEVGASRALTILEDELVRTMRLCGVRTIEEIDSSLLFKSY